MNTLFRSLALAAALLAVAGSAQAGFEFRLPLKGEGARAAPPVAAASGAFALQSEIAGASGRPSTFLADSSCRAALGSAPSLTFWMGANSTSAVSYNAGTGVFTVAALPSGGDGSAQGLILADKTSGNQCSGSAPVYSRTGWWPVTMTAAYAPDGTLTSTLTSPGFSASNTMCTGADYVFNRDTSGTYSLTGTPGYPAYSMSSTVCIESVPEIAKPFSYTNGVPDHSWAPVGDTRTTINSAVLAGRGNGVVLVDPWVYPRVHLVTVAAVATSYTATGAVAADAPNPRYLSYFTAWVAGKVDRDVPMTLADWMVDNDYWLNDYPLRPLYTSKGAWDYPYGELARTTVHSVIP